MRQYIVEIVAANVALVTLQDNTIRLTSTNRRQTWIDTCNSYDDAKGRATAESKRDNVIMACVIEWDCDEPATVLQTCNYSTRHCSRGSRIVSVPLLLERNDSNTWSQVPCGTKNYSVGGGNWLTYN